ncbi:MAG: long-subunit fatty acid transport protein [Myxococcota bacterium]|jgi:long-subunit fatty acid transport protein
MRRTSTLTLALCLATALPLTASAAGYDTPILYSARHIGMGGTGISFVKDPTAMFINPAGIGHTSHIIAHVDFSPIFAQIDAAPECGAGPGLISCSGTNPKTGLAATAGPVLAPAFLAGGAFRVHENVTLGLSIFPLASAGGGYAYSQPAFPAGSGDEQWEDDTAIAFIEISPGVAVNFPLGGAGNLRLGATYRITLAQLSRFKKSEANEAATFDLDMSGFNFEGVRVGLQWDWEGLQLGVVYRNKIVADVEADSSVIVGSEKGKTTMDLTLPSRIGAGLRYDIADFGIALDYEYAWQSQNKVSKIIAFNTAKGENDDPLNSYFLWKDASTIRAGLEYRFLGTMAARLGYVWDQETSNKVYVSAFGTPPTDTNTATVGFGYDGGPWEINVAYAFRTGSVDVGDEDVTLVSNGGNRPETCLTCGYAGTYELTLHGAYVDFSWEWE